MARRGQTDPEDADALHSQRIDRWIWHARFHRTRENAAGLVRSGHVRVDGRRILQPGYSLKAGQVLTLALPGRTLVIEVLGFADRRGGPHEAVTLYRTIDDGSPQAGA